MLTVGYIITCTVLMRVSPAATVVALHECQRWRVLATVQPASRLQGELYSQLFS